VPEDASILEYDLMGKPIFLIPDESPALKALREILNSIERELYA
jgi:CO dehydrogenase nickel-insertion accessory protein CooC1